MAKYPKIHKTMYPHKTQGAPMARTVTPLTDAKIKQAKPKEKDYKLSDGGGLFLLVTKRNTKLWRLKYKIDGKEKLLALGTYPEVSLKKARELREENKQLVFDGIDPVELRKKLKQEADEKRKKALNTLDKVVSEFSKQIESSVTPRYHKKLMGYYENHIKPFLGDIPIIDIERKDILAVVDKMQNQGIFESTKKTLNLLERVYKYAIVREYVKHNLIADFDKKMLLKKKPVRHHPTFTDDESIRLLFEMIEKYQGEIITKYALKLIAYLALRPKELRSLKWEYVDIKNKLITIPASEMKMRKEHLVPLTQTVIKMLKELKKFTGDKIYLFPNTVYKDRYMSENTINVALRRMGFSKDEIVSHGFRSMFSTIANEKSPFGSDVIETQLAHSVGNSVSQAYNRSVYLDERVKLMQWWSDYLDEVQRK